MRWNQFPCSLFCPMRRSNPSPPSSHSFGQLRFQGKLRSILGPYPSWSWALGQAPQKMFQGMMGRCLVGGHKALLTSNYSHYSFNIVTTLVTSCTLHGLCTTQGLHTGVAQYLHVSSSPLLWRKYQRMPLNKSICELAILISLQGYVYSQIQLTDLLQYYVTAPQGGHNPLFHPFPTNPSPWLRVCGQEYQSQYCVYRHSTLKIKQQTGQTSEILIGLLHAKILSQVDKTLTLTDSHSSS